MIALRELARDIADHGFVIPIIEPVNQKSTMLISIDRFMDESMEFLLVCNPINGEFSANTNLLVGTEIEQALRSYDNWIPALYVDNRTTVKQVNSFMRERKYFSKEKALIYRNNPERTVLSEINMVDIKHHIFFLEKVSEEYIESIPKENRVYIKDRFDPHIRNADYPTGRQPFTSLNTRAKNKENIDFGDFSIVGDYYSDTGGLPRAVALHHVHFAEDSNSLEISHYVSNRKEYRGEIREKTLEAIDKLVESLKHLRPSNTRVCAEYREMYETRNPSGLGPMKGLAIRHHLEVIMSDGGLEFPF